MNVEIGTEAALFPEKEYINGIFVAVYGVPPVCSTSGLLSPGGHPGLLSSVRRQGAPEDAWTTLRTTVAYLIEQ
jgi:hypothetical protein